MSILVTGGAGYIGSFTVKALLKKGYNVIAYDNLSSGSLINLPEEALFIKGDICDKESLDALFRNHKISSVIHLAACIQAGESETNPEKYYTNNLVGSINLLNSMLKNNVKKIVFSSSAAVYGEASPKPLAEESKKIPCNPYGHTKLMFEHVLESYAEAHEIKFIVLRYFNAAGLSEDYPSIKSFLNASHLIPNVLSAAIGKTEQFEIFGTDYPTDDGTCIRDFVHVSDIAKANILALQALEKGHENKYYNVGLGKGYSVKEIVKACEKVTGKKIKSAEKARRKGDPFYIVSDPSNIKKDLSWTPEFDEIIPIIESAWKVFSEKHSVSP